MQTKNIFFYLISSVILLLASSFHQKISAEDAWEKERGKAKAAISETKLENEISFLADSICQGRASGTKGIVESAMWIRRRFEDAGLVRIHDSWAPGFSIRHRLRGHNVVAMLPGSKSIPCDRYIIVGAHYDHLGLLDGKLYPGADSNASGVVAMTNLAEMFSSMREMGRIYNSNIIFVAFDAKEYDMKGSQALWDLIEYGRLKNPVTGSIITEDKISLMVNLDQIGSSLAPLRKDRKDYLIMLGTPSLKKNRRHVLEECNSTEDINLDIALDYYGSANFTEIFYKLSDQKVFAENKIPAVLFTSGITMNNNKTWDRTENLDLEVLRKRIWLIFHWLEKMA